MGEPAQRFTINVKQRIQGACPEHLAVAFHLVSHGLQMKVVWSWRAGRGRRVRCREIMAEP